MQTFKRFELDDFENFDILSGRFARRMKAQNSGQTSSFGIRVERLIHTQVRFRLGLLGLLDLLEVGPHWPTKIYVDNIIYIFYIIYEDVETTFTAKRYINLKSLKTFNRNTENACFLEPVHQYLL